LQHRHHHQVARAERTIEPVGIAQATGKLRQPVADAILDQGQALMPQNGLVVSKKNHSQVDRSLFIIQPVSRGE
jgi:hypothetical protein